MRNVLIGLTAIASLALAGCTEANAPGGGGGTVSVSFAGRTAGAASSSSILAAPAATATLADELVITTAQAVVRKIELKSAAEDECEDSEQEDSCEEIKAGPVLVDIPTTAGATTEVTADVPNGTYHELEIQLHKLTGNDPGIAELRTAHPEFADKSIRVTGTFNGTAFTFESDITAVLQFELDPELVVTDGSVTTNLTVNFSLDDWFKTADGTLIDPATANKGGPNEQLVKNNIRKSLRAFEDQDHDGDEDNDHAGPGHAEDDDDSSGPGHSGDDNRGGHGGGGQES